MIKFFNFLKIFALLIMAIGMNDADYILVCLGAILFLSIKQMQLEEKIGEESYGERNS